MKLRKKKQRFLITGGSGFLGSYLTRALLEDGHKITILTRHKQKALDKFGNKVKAVVSLEGLKGEFDVIINLAGESLLGSRWTSNKKQEIVFSRVRLTEKLVSFIKKAKTPPKLFISGSAIGYYGTSLNEKFTEDSSPASDNFASSICKNWENAAILAKDDKLRLCIIRTGVVLEKDHGMLKQMLPAFKLGLGGKIGNGKQYISWITIDDFMAAIAFIINNKDMEGAINLTAPNPVANKTFAKTFAKVLGRPAITAMPAFVVRLMFGQVADELLLSGQYVIPKKLLDAGYKFKYPELQAALEHLLK